MHRQGELDHAQIRTEVSARPRQRLDKESANLLRQLAQLRVIEALDIGGGLDRLQQYSHLLPSPGPHAGNCKKKAPDLRGAIIRRIPNPQYINAPASAL